MIRTLLSRFRMWWTGPSAVLLPDWKLVMYTRRGCHLCEAAWEELRAEQIRFQFALAMVDIDTDPELKALYGDEVPVVTVNGKVRFRCGVNKVLLCRLLKAETVKRSRGEKQT